MMDCKVALTETKAIMKKQLRFSKKNEEVAAKT